VCPGTSRSTVLGGPGQAEVMDQGVISALAQGVNRDIMLCKFICGQWERQGVFTVKGKPTKYHHPSAAFERQQLYHGQDREGKGYTCEFEEDAVR
jgi:hypothetical protein